MARSQIILHGGRDRVGEIADCGADSLSRGVDVAISVRDQNGKLMLIPGVISMVIRVEGRKAVATVELLVDDIELTAVWLEEIKKG